MPPMTSIWPNPKDIFYLWSYLLIFCCIWYGDSPWAPLLLGFWFFYFLNYYFSAEPGDPFPLPIHHALILPRTLCLFLFLTMYLLVMSSTFPVNWVFQVHIPNYFLDLHPRIMHSTTKSLYQNTNSLLLTYLDLVCFFNSTFSISGP